MIGKLKLVDRVVAKEAQTKLHPEILNILLENRRYVKSVFLEINGLYDIAHFGLTIVDPSNEMVVFSSTPNIEYNLIHQNLWKHDPCFSSLMQDDNGLSWWNTDQLVDNGDEIERIKLQNNKFSFGVTISRPVNNFCFLYSFATRSKRDDLSEYYTSNIGELIDIGDYFYKSIMDIYSSYSIKYKPPTLGHLMPKASRSGCRPYLKLVVSPK